MNASPELVAEIATGNIKSIDILYSDGQNISGVLKNAKFDQIANPTITLNKLVTRKGEDSKHRVDFQQATRITIQYQNGETKVFE